MADVASIQAGLASLLGSISGLRTQDQTRDIVAIPVAVIGLPDSVTYDFTFARGADTYVFTVRVLTGRASERAAGVLLASYLSGTGSSSIKAAVESDPTLGGSADTTRVQSASGIGAYQYGDIDYLGVEFTIEVIA